MNIYHYLKEMSGLSLTLGCLNKGLVRLVDAAHADNNNRKSTSGYIFFFSGLLILWSYKK